MSSQKSTVSSTFLIVLILGLFSGSAAFSGNCATAPGTGDQVQTVIHATSDAIPGDMYLRLALNADCSIAGARFDIGTDLELLDLAQLPQGLVVYNSGGHDVMKLQSNRFSPQTGGAVNLIYLTNGATGNYANFPMGVYLNGSNWGAYVSENSTLELFTSMFFHGAYFFGQLVGIGSISVS